jgi:D-alanine-D-alanine ligase
MTSAKLKVAVLYDVWEDDTAPSEVAEEKTSARKTKRKSRIEKEDREEISEALEKLGHEPFYQVLDGRPQCLTALAKCDADLVFNLTESFAGDDTKEMNVAAYMDLLGIRYTGGGPHAHFLAQDKGTAKKMFAFHEIKTPFFATSYRGRIEHAHDIAFPLIVKPVSEDGSIGINADAVVNSVKELMERVEYIQNEFDSPALIEEYTKVHLTTDLDEETITRLQETALAAYHAVKLRDYGRIDMRLTEKGEVYVIEANPNPWLSSKQEFAMAAKASGRSYTQLIGEIVELAMQRYAPRSGTESIS